MLFICGSNFHPSHASLHKPLKKGWASVEAEWRNSVSVLFHGFKWHPVHLVWKSQDFQSVRLKRTRWTRQTETAWTEIFICLWKKQECGFFVLALKINESQIQLLCDLAAVCGNIKGIKWFKPYKVLRVIFNLYPVFFVEYRYTIWAIWIM